MDDNPFSVLNVDRRPSSKWKGARRIFVGSLTRTTLTVMVLLWIFLSIWMSNRITMSDGSSGGETTTLGYVPAFVIYREFDVLPNGSEKTVAQSYSLDLRPHVVIRFFSGLALLSFIIALILSLQ